MRTACVCLAALALNCTPEQPPAPPPPPPAAPLGPVAPGNYTNHVGNPAAGQWGPDGQWQWHNPQSPEADSTMKYLAAAGVGAAAGGLATYMLTRKQFEKQNPSGWSAAANTREVKTYVDKRGNPISKEEYERRRAQSERDKQRYQQQKQQQQQQAKPQQYRDKNGKFISKQEHERRQAQSERDKQRYQQQKQTPKRSSRSRSRSRRK